MTLIFWKQKQLLAKLGNEVINAAIVKKKKEKKHDYKVIIRFSCMVYKLDQTAIPRASKGSIFSTHNLPGIQQSLPYPQKIGSQTPVDA